MKTTGATGNCSNKLQHFSPATRAIHGFQSVAYVAACLLIREGVYLQLFVLPFERLAVISDNNDLHAFRLVRKKVSEGVRATNVNEY